MNAVGIALLWCMVQVTLLGVLAGALYLIARRIRPGAGAAVALSGLLAVVVLSVLALSPWPRWSFDLANRSRTDWQSVPENGGTDVQSVAPRVDGLAIRPTPNDRGVSNPTENGQDSAVSVAASLWRGLLESLSRAQSAAAGTAWAWPAVLAVVVLTGMAAGLVWLLLGLVAVRWHRVRSRPVDDASVRALVNQLRAELGCPRPVELRQSDDLVTAATIGWRRPCILLPPEWASWTADQRRAVLAHEMAHVRRNDFLAVLAGQLGVVLHFYHPLLHWLMGRLRLEQELAADAAAAAVSGGQRQYLVAIAELALRQQDRALAWPARSFLPTRTTFLRRITMLRDSKLRLERLSTPLRIVIVAAVAACGLLVAGLRGPSSYGAGVSPAQAAAGETAAPQPAADDSIDTTFFTENAAVIIVMRPAAAVARPDFAEVAKMLEDLPDVFPKEGHLADLRQVTVILPDHAVEKGPREIVVFQWTKPYRIPLRSRMTVMEYRGKKLLVTNGPPSGIGGFHDQYDKNTIVTAGSEKAMTDYLSSKRGVLPKWLPAKEWESFRRDHFVVAADGAFVRREMGQTAGHEPPMTRAFLTPFSPVWENATFMAAGGRLDGRLAMHACVGTSSPSAATSVAQTIEAVKVLAQNTAKGARAQFQTMPGPTGSALLALLDLGNALSAKLHSRYDDAHTVWLDTSAELPKGSLDALVQGVLDARQAATRTLSVNNLRQIAVAMYEYANKHKRLPSAVLYGPDGKTPYSWRVALLPFLDQKTLYDRYHFDEPWDGPNNRKLLAEIPVFYRSPADSPTSTNAAYFPLVGPRTAFAPNETVDFGRSFTDGASNTIMLVEAKRDVPWTKPEDIPFEPDKPVPTLGGFFPGVFHAVLCDASVHTFRLDMPQDILRLLIDKDDRQPVPWDKIR